MASKDAEHNHFLHQASSLLMRIQFPHFGGPFNPNSQNKKIGRHSYDRASSAEGIGAALSAGAAFSVFDWAHRQVSSLGASSSGNGNPSSPGHPGAADRNFGDAARRWWPGGRKKRLSEALGAEIPGSGWGEAFRLAEEALEMERCLHVEDAARVFEKVVLLEPKNAPFIARLSKQYSDMTYLPGITDARAREVNEKAMELAARAIEADPGSAAGYLADCVSRGRLALLSDNKTKIRLAKEARESAVVAMQLDPKNDVALHLMGRWHYEMARINFLARALVSVMYGTQLPEGTFQDALKCYEDAMAANPGRLVHRVEAGRIRMQMGDRPQAQRLLESALSCEVIDINDMLTLRDAEGLLRDLKRKGGPGGISLP